MAMTWQCLGAGYFGQEIRLVQRKVVVSGGPDWCGHLRRSGRAQIADGTRLVRLSCGVFRLLFTLSRNLGAF
jgi:hypothetical protein